MVVCQRELRHCLHGMGDLQEIRDSLPFVLQGIVDLVQMRMQQEAQPEAHVSGLAFCQLLHQLAETELDEPQQHETNEKLANEFQTLLQEYDTLSDALHVLRLTVGWIPDEQETSSGDTSIVDSENRSIRSSEGPSQYPALQRWFHARNKDVQDINKTLPEDLKGVVGLVSEKMHRSWEFTDALELCRILQHVASADVEAQSVKDKFLSELQKSETLRDALQALRLIFAEGELVSPQVPTPGSRTQAESSISRDPQSREENVKSAEGQMDVEDDFERLMNLWTPMPVLQKIKDRLLTLRESDTSSRLHFHEVFKLLDELFNHVNVRTRGTATNDSTDELGEELLELLQEAQSCEEIATRIREDYF